jgi:predicted O-linked N-acetylglucosamine transferase (SPINDLY family)
MEILKQVPHSVLWLANGPQGAIENLKASAADLGVDPNRIVVATRCAMDEYLNRLGLIDLYLDTFPYTSGTVASDALFVGCPLLTLSGKTMVSRMAGSILNSVGLTELITFTLDDYVKKAVDLGFNLAERERIRQFLIDQKSKKVLFNCKKSAVELETLIEKITL